MRSRSFAAVAAALLAVLALLPASTAAQQSAYRVTQLASGVYAITRQAELPISDANTLVIVNDSDVVVVDTNILPSYSREVIREIRRLTPLPVRYLINTHWHSDHHYGNAVYREAYPGVEIVQHAATREAVITRDLPDLEGNVATAYPAELARYRGMLERGLNSRGTPLTDAQRRQVTQMIEIFETFLRDMPAYPPVLASLTFTDSLVLHRGERTIVVKWLGRGNTAGDVVVHLPRERIVATGDLVVIPVPFAFYSYLSAWPQTLRQLRAIDAAWIMPGHGDVQRDWSFVDKLAPLLESVWTQVSAAVAAGATLAETKTRVRVDALRDALIGTDPALQRSFTATFFDPAIEAAYAELKPTPPPSSPPSAPR